jgi:hypothetical protein
MTQSQKSDGALAELEAEALKGAIGKLSIQGVFLINNQSKISEEFSPSDFKAKDYTSQGFSRRLHIGLDESILDYGFNVAVGLRMVRKDDAKKAKGSETDDFTCMEVRAQFLAVYKASEILTDEEQEAFHRNNVLYHVWPYWREFVQQMGWRMGAPFMAVPMLKALPKLT